MIRARGVRWWGLLGALGGIGACASTQARVSDAHFLSCHEALAQYPDLSQKADYAALTERPRYEAFIAGCMVDEHRAGEALRLVSKLNDAALRPQVLQVTARASAALGKEKDVHAALDELATFGSEIPEEFWGFDELRPYRTQDWFILDAIATWSPSSQLSLDRYVERILRHANQDLLPLRVAVADPQQGAGPWAIWTGKIRDAHIDRAANKTIVVAEGVDVSRQLVRVDRDLVRVDYRQSSWGFVRSSPFAGGQIKSSDTRGHVDLDPKYDTTETYQESFTPNGLEFIVEYPEASADLVQAQTIQAIGRYGGRDQDGKPLLNASVVAKRTEARSSVNLGTER